MSNEVMLLLGEIKGELTGIKGGLARQDEKLDAIDNRLRGVEIKAAVSGSVAGGIMAVGVSLITASIQAVTGHGGGS